jgi:hypothetical protein
MTDSLVIIRVASHVFQRTLPLPLHPLQVNNFFPSWMVVTRDLVYAYERQLKRALSELALHCNESFDSVCSRIQCGCDFTPPSCPLDIASEGPLVHKLLVELNTGGDLPAIVFMFSRRGCENEAMALGERLRQRKLKNKPVVASRRANKDKRKIPEPKTKEEKRKQDEMREDKRQAVSFFNPEYSFAGKLSPTLVKWKSEWYLQRLTPMERDLFQLFEYGIGVHHAGLSRTYRNMVEVFFRAGHIRVVFATSTLALGINMPVKTIIFMHNSPFLTSLMFRQMSGRAGRRGFDNIGKVVFLNFSHNEKKELMLSNLRSLQGQFPFTVTSVLQISLCTASLPLSYSLRFLDPVRVYPLFAFVQGPKRRNDIQLQLQFLSRFALEFLRRNRLIDVAGRGIGLVAISSHLHYHHPANLILPWLIQHSVLRELCADFPRDKNDTARKLLHFLAHIYNTKPLPRLLSAAMRRRCKSKIIMPPLASREQAGLQAYNMETLATFADCVRIMCERAPDVAMNFSLPLSGVSFLSSTSPCVTNVLDPIKAIPFVSRSPFVAISGRGDSFSSATELATTCMESARFSAQFVPVVEDLNIGLHCSELNSYVLDFFGHGDLVEISEVNEITGAWSYLNDWSLLLSGIVVALKMAHYEAVDPIVCKTFEHLKLLWSEKFARYTRTMLDLSKPKLYTSTHM